MSGPAFSDEERAAARRLIDMALEEDHAREDVTSALAVAAENRTEAVVRNRAWGCLAGIECVKLTLDALGADARVVECASDGGVFEPGSILLRVEGRLRDLLPAERTFLNLVGLLSGTATLTRRFVDLAGESCRVLDTRKTYPGARALQKYAVRCGGGVNHRQHLADGILLKDNHREGGRGLDELVRRARQEHGALPLVIEVDDHAQLEEAVELRPDRILLDNYGPAAIREAVALRDRIAPGLPLEVSGGVDLETVAGLAAAGADFVSVGALTHSAPVWDLGLDRPGQTARG